MSAMAKIGPVAEAVKSVLLDGEWHDREEAIQEAMKRVPPILAMEHSRQAFHYGKRAERVKPVTDAYLIRVGSRRLVGLRLGTWCKNGTIEIKTDDDGRRWVRYTKVTTSNGTS